MNSTSLFRIYFRFSYLISRYRYVSHFNWTKREKERWQLRQLWWTSKIIHIYTLNHILKFQSNRTVNWEKEINVRQDIARTRRCIFDSGPDAVKVEPAEKDVPKVVVKKIEGKMETLERHVPQMLLRGEQVAIIVKINWLCIIVLRAVPQAPCHVHSIT